MKQPTIDSIFIRFCQVRGVKPEVIRKKTRLRRIVSERQMFCYFIRKEFPHMTTLSMGECLNLNHSTVSVSIGVYNNLVNTYPKIMDEYKSLVKQMDASYENDNR